MCYSILYIFFFIHRMYVDCYWWYWGGEEGRGTEVGPDQETPEFQNEEVICVSAGSRHTILIDKNGDAFASGFIETFNSYQGHMGIDRSRLQQGPNEWMNVDIVVNKSGARVPAPKFMKVYAGAGAPGDSRDMHSILISATGDVYIAGNNDMGQLCTGDTNQRDLFTQVNGLPAPAVAAGVGLDFTLILLENGQVYGCGSNENGELGLGPGVSSTTTPRSNGLMDIVELSTGLNYGIYLKSLKGQGTGTVYGSGSNLFSQLCEDTQGDPVLVPMVRYYISFVNLLWHL